jgi:hypothetical protein
MRRNIFRFGSARKKLPATPSQHHVNFRAGLSKQAGSMQKYRNFFYLNQLNHFYYDFSYNKLLAPH